MSILSSAALRQRLCDNRDEFKISPILDWTRQIGAGAVDLRLGNEFLVTTRSQLPALDPASATEIRRALPEYQRRIKVPYGEKYVLHPHELTLGSSFEFLSFPDDLMAYVDGRSSWGRLGLVIATAPVVNPGFKGCITLELINIGNVPIVLYPFVRIAQLVVHQMEGKDTYQGKYRVPVGPEFSAIYEDAEMPLLSRSAEDGK